MRFWLILFVFFCWIHPIFSQHQSALKSHIEYLSSPLLQGRLTGSFGQKLSAIYLQNQFDSVVVDPFEVVQMQHGGFLVNAADTLIHRRDFFYSGLNRPFAGMLSLDTFEVIQCQAADLYALKTQYENKNALFLLRDWEEFLDLFGHEFLEEEIVLAKDFQQKPLHLFIKDVNFSPAHSLEAVLIKNYKHHFTENLMIPLYSNANNTETWIFSAHYDHLGFTDSTYFPGADDNASGLAVLLTLSELLKKTPIDFPVNVTFAFFSAEEQGLLGSRYYVQYSPHFDETITACFNFDMVGFVAKPELQIINYTRSDNPKPTLNFDFKQPKSFEIQTVSEELFLHEFSSDHLSFAEKNIPAYLFFTGLHAYYHSPNDTPEKLNYDAMNELVLWLVAYLGGE